MHKYIYLLHAYLSVARDTPVSSYCPFPNLKTERPRLCIECLQIMGARVVYLLRVKILSAVSYLSREYTGYSVDIASVKPSDIITYPLTVDLF